MGTEPGLVIGALASTGVKRPVVANLVMLAVIGAGIVFGLNLRREFFPEVRPNEVLVTAPYPGAAPDEVERSLAIKIEDPLSDLTDVVEINTIVSEGVAIVRVEFEDGTDIDAAVADVKREIDALQDLPEDADKIVVTSVEPNLPAVVLALYGENVDERVLKDEIRRMRDDLRTLPGMGDVTVNGTRRDEIRVEVSPGSLIEHGLSVANVADQIAAAMVELPTGITQGSQANRTTRVDAPDRTAEGVRDIVVTARDGQRVTVDDIADVTEGFVDTDVYARYNRQPTVSLTAFKVGNRDVVEISEMVKAYAKGRRGDDLKLNPFEQITLALAGAGAGEPSHRVQAYHLGLSRFHEYGPPPGTLIETTDLARFVVGRLDLLTRNAFWGGVLVFGVLVLLLNWRVSFWVATGLIVAMLGTLAMMHFVGLTLNLLSMFGLIIVIGILVDDAIVVAENITAHHERGAPARVAAIEGTKQVGWPVVATVLTSVFAFLPLALVEGVIGDFMQFLPVIVGVSLMVSLLEALFILPSHMAESLAAADKRGNANQGWFARLERRMDRWRTWFFDGFITPGYMGLLRVAIKYRYIAVAVSMGIALISIGMITGGRLPFIFFETEDAETINIEVRMPVGTPTDETLRVVKKLERAALTLSSDLAPDGIDVPPDEDAVLSVFAQAGSIGDLNGEGNDSDASHIGQLVIELRPVEDRDISSEQVRELIRDRAGELPGVESLRMAEVSGGPGGPALTYTATGESRVALDAAVAELKRVLSEYDAIYDIADDAQSGQRELRFKLRNGAAEMGFNEAFLGRQIQGAVRGIEAFTFAGDREDVDVRVMLPENVRTSAVALEDLFVFTPQGNPVPLGEIAEVEEGEAYASVTRLNRQRAVTVTAEVRRAEAIPEEIQRELKPRIAEIADAYPGIQFLERGRQEDVNDSFSSLPLGMMVALVLVYVTLAILFDSFIQPLVVMSAIPFAVIGMVFGHMLMGYAMTFLSVIGFVALSGIVVNDSLIFIEFFNEERAAGKGVRESALAAGRARVRAILLTTITTVLGLLPLLTEQSLQARFLIPMAITLAFGLMSGTLIILVVLPCLLMVVSDLRHVLHLLWHGKQLESPDNPFRDLASREEEAPPSGTPAGA